MSYNFMMAQSAPHNMHIAFKAPSSFYSFIWNWKHNWILPILHQTIAIGAMPIGCIIPVMKKEGGKSNYFPIPIQTTTSPYQTFIIKIGPTMLYFSLFIWQEIIIPIVPLNVVWYMVSAIVRDKQVLSTKCWAQDFLH